MRKKSSKKQGATNPDSMPMEPMQSASSSRLKPAASDTGGLASAESSTNVKSAKPTITPEQWNDAVQKKAFELFEQRGYMQGNDLGDWFDAEKIVKQSMQSTH
jgi:hypothetical protein